MKKVNSIEYMKSYSWFLLFIIFPLFVSCIEDNTTDAIRPISYITIESGIDSVYNINKNDTLIIKPHISQSIDSKELRYTWEMDLKAISNEKDLFFVGDKLGKYNCRLIVSNEDGKAFFPFILYVNSPYEEGITLLSVDNNGKSMISFMQARNITTDSTAFYNYDCFKKNNPDISFAANAADIVQSNGNLILACQGGGENNETPTIYYLNEKTMVVENMFKVPEYTDFKPTILGIPLESYSGTSYPVVCENGKVYEFSTTEAAISKPRNHKYTYAQNCIVNYGSGYDILLWDYDNNGLSLITNGYGPYYCSNEFNLTLNDPDFKEKNYFNNRGFVTMVKINMTPAQKIETAQFNEMLIITNIANSIITRSEVLLTSIWGYDSSFTPTFPITNISQSVVVNNPLNATTPCIANKTFYSLLFADGNKVRCWNYNSNVSKLANAKTLLTVGSEKAVITGFEISKDHLKTYVSFYEPEQEGLNGSLWVFDTDKGTVLEKYENICYRPVKMIYKNR